MEAHVQKDVTVLSDEGQYKPWPNDDEALEIAIQTSHFSGFHFVKDQNDTLLYIGESSDLGERLESHNGDTYISTLRRSIGTDILGFSLREIKGKWRYFSEDENEEVTKFLKTCKWVALPGSSEKSERVRLKEELIEKYNPRLNKKGKRKTIEEKS
ncbi:MAG: GIY-YIG nuclease family protein [Tannerellaceae bacterium]|jgi:excinuclease UvrABC nuclease subunit|nr:GIY-YIG nuclease family protein [Tannerellaceae bacterium]